jgi:hypothetical protein
MIFLYPLMFDSKLFTVSVCLSSLELYISIDVQLYFAYLNFKTSYDGKEPDCHYTWHSTSHNLLPKCQVHVRFCDELCVPEVCLFRHTHGHLLLCIGRRSKNLCFEWCAL